MTRSISDYQVKFDGFLKISENQHVENGKGIYQLESGPRVGKILLISCVNRFELWKEDPTKKEQF